MRDIFALKINKILQLNYKILYQRKLDSWIIQIKFPLLKGNSTKTIQHNCLEKLTHYYEGSILHTNKFKKICRNM